MIVCRRDKKGTWCVVAVAREGERVTRMMRMVLDYWIKTEMIFDVVVL